MMYKNIDTILTSKRNASSKMLHNLLHRHHTCAKLLSVLMFVCVLLNENLGQFQEIIKISKRINNGMHQETMIMM